MPRQRRQTTKQRKKKKKQRGVKDKLGKRREQEVTYSFCFFLGPGLPLIFGSPTPFVAPAALLAPFFFGPSVGGPMGCGAGVPPAAGVAGFESDTFSPLEAGAAGSVTDVAGESLASLGGGVSSFTTDAGSRIGRSLSAGNLSVSVRLGLEGLVPRTKSWLLVLAPADLRRSLAAEALLAEGAMWKGQKRKVGRRGKEWERKLNQDGSTGKMVERGGMRKQRIRWRGKSKVQG